MRILKRLAVSSAILIGLALAPRPAAAQSTTSCPYITYEGGFPNCATIVGGDDGLLFAAFGGYAAYQTMWWILDWWLASQGW